MTAPRVRANYDSLGQVARSFGQQAEQTGRSLEQLKRQMAVLQAGDWLGQGATAFYQEMDNQLLPRLQRLVRALEAGAQQAGQISQVMKQAEDEAARVLTGPGGAAAAGSVAGAAAGGVAGAAGGAAAAGAVAGAAGGASAAGSVAGAAGGAAAAGSVAGAAGGAAAAGAVAGAAAGGAAAAGSVAGAAAGGPAPAGPAAPGPGDTPGLDPQLTQNIAKSPTLTAQMAVLKAQGWTFDEVPLDKNQVLVNGQTKHIILKSDLDPGLKAGVLSQVASQQLAAPSATIHPDANMSRDEYVRMSAAEELRSEGSVLVNYAAAHTEMLAHGGPDMGWPSGIEHGDQVQLEHINTLLQSNRISRDQAIQMAGDVFGSVTEPGATINNWEARANAFRQHWDQNADTQGWGKNR